MLVTLTEVLEQAEIGSYGVVAPDFPSLYSAQLMIQLAEELRAPLILSYAAVFKPMMDVPIMPVLLTLFGVKLNVSKCQYACI